jgi:hypothetical protein
MPDVRRRELIALLGGAAAWPLTGARAAGQPHACCYKGMQARLEGLRQGLERLGRSDGRNIRVVYRFGEGKPDRLQPLRIFSSSRSTTTPFCIRRRCS